MARTVDTTAKTANNRINDLLAQIYGSQLEKVLEKIEMGEYDKWLPLIVEVTIQRMRVIKRGNRFVCWVNRYRR